MHISLCIPMYNEQKLLGQTMDTVRRDMEKWYGSDWEVLWVDDGSTDDTRAIAMKRAEDCPGFRVLSYDGNRGKGYAVRTGVLASRGDVVVFTDCDLAYGTEVVRQIDDILRENPVADAVMGSREAHPEGYAGYTPLRRFASRSCKRMLRTVGRLPVSDSQSGIKGFRGDFARRVFALCQEERFSLDYEMIMIASKMGAHLVEMPVKIVFHRPGNVRLVRDSYRMVRDMIRIRRRIRKMDLTAADPAGEGEGL